MKPPVDISNPEYTVSELTPKREIEWVAWTVQELIGSSLGDDSEKKAIVAYCCKLRGLNRSLTYKYLETTFIRMNKLIKKYKSSYNIPYNAWVIAVITE